MSIDRAGRWAGVAAALLWTAAVLGFGAALPGFEQALHPLALLGASGVPNAMASESAQSRGRSHTSARGDTRRFSAPQVRWK